VNLLTFNRLPAPPLPLEGRNKTGLTGKYFLLYIYIYIIYYLLFVRIRLGLAMVIVGDGFRWSGKKTKRRKEWKERERIVTVLNNLGEVQKECNLCEPLTSVH
jgi:hypothetical protein